MKATVIWLALSVLAACSVSHKSQEFSCTKNTDCAGHPNTICDNGFCVVPGTIDAPGMKRDAPTSGDGSNGCPAGCTSCNVQQKTCTIDCSISGSNCGAFVQCPQGYHCDIQCKGDGACSHGVSCIGGGSRATNCIGTNSCRSIQCGTGPCDVTCGGQQSCRDISCNNSCACDVLCSGPSSCQSGITC